MKRTIVKEPCGAAKKVELLAPAGNMECLRTALYFGADAVYISGKSHGLRAFANNFTTEEMAEAVRLVKAAGKRLYVTVNAVFRNPDFEGLDEYLLALCNMGVDALIISDPGVLAKIRTLCPGMEIHLSTQMNTSNFYSADFWHQCGVRRIVLSRELSLDEISEINLNIPEGLETEVFVHGAMCIAYSGRCLLSSVMTGRSGNKGECAQPCRWEYMIREKGSTEQFPILEDERGTYILNSKDLMMIEYLDQLIASGVSSLKVEGRMKSTYYVASVINAYRRAIDAYYEDPEHYRPEPWIVDELRLSATRRFTTGFYFGNPGSEAQDVEKDYDQRGFSISALVRDKSREGMVFVEQRNKFSIGESLNILSPNMAPQSFKVERIINMQGMEQPSAPHPQQLLHINCPYSVREGDILRIIK